MIIKLNIDVTFVLLTGFLIVSQETRTPRYWLSKLYDWIICPNSGEGGVGLAEISSDNQRCVYVLVGPLNQSATL